MLKINCFLQFRVWFKIYVLGKIKAWMLLIGEIFNDPVNNYVIDGEKIIAFCT
jgi:hypothetical protein